LGDITALAEKIGGGYRPEIWERRLSYYFRRDPEASTVAEADGRVVGFMFGEVRAGEFGLDEPTGWIEVMGVAPEMRGQAVGRKLADRMLEYFKSRGAKSVRTLVDEEMEGIGQFFSALGFQPAKMTSLVKIL
jgi:ribosomal protein S18 acetylase RimI-like enzyme